MVLKTEKLDSEQNTSDRLTVAALKEMETGTRIETRLLVRESSQRKTSGGKPYVAMTLGDETGAIECRAWDTDCGDDGPPSPGTVVDVGGKRSEWEDTPQLTLDRFEAVEDAPLDGLVPSAYRDGADILEDVRDIVDMWCSPPLAAVVLEAMDVLADELATSPAASGHHHARLAGLIEHVESMVIIAMAVSDHYDHRYGSELDIGLIIAAIVLHDAGKCVELSGPVGTEYTDEGRLVGHIAHGLLLVEQARHAVDEELDGDTLRHLRHLILSHHGTKEWGSPVEPKSAEAVLLHQLDMLDSRMDAVLTAITSADDDATWAEGAYGTKFWIGTGEVDHG